MKGEIKHGQGRRGIKSVIFFSETGVSSGVGKKKKHLTEENKTIKHLCGTNRALHCWCNISVEK